MVSSLAEPPRCTAMFSVDSLETGLFVTAAIVRGLQGVKRERNFPLAKYTCVKPRLLFT